MPLTEKINATSENINNANINQEQDQTYKLSRSSTASSSSSAISPSSAINIAKRSSTHPISRLQDRYHSIKLSSSVSSDEEAGEDEESDEEGKRDYFPAIVTLHSTDNNTDYKKTTNGTSLHSFHHPRPHPPPLHPIHFPPPHLPSLSSSSSSRFNFSDASLLSSSPTQSSLSPTRTRSSSSRSFHELQMDYLVQQSSSASASHSTAATTTTATAASPLPPHHSSSLLLPPHYSPHFSSSSLSASPSSSSSTSFHSPSSSPQSSLPPSPTNTTHSSSSSTTCIGHINLIDTAGSNSSECYYPSDDSYWYFAIGSMINPISLKLRNLTPIESHPAICRGYALIFDGNMGMATISPDPHGQFHGVLHRLPADEMSILDKIEGGYVRRSIQTILYDGRLQNGYAYMMDEAEMDRTCERNLPPERYLDIIIRGCCYYHVSITHIQWLLQLPCVKRKCPTQYLSFINQYDGDSVALGKKNMIKKKTEKQEEEGDEKNNTESMDKSSSQSSSSTSPSSPCSSPKSSPIILSTIDINSLPVISMAELSTYDGNDNRPLCFGVNGKVIQCYSNNTANNSNDNINTSNTTSNEDDNITYTWIHQYGGVDATLTIARFIYEPLYPIAQSRLCMSDGHGSWCEDMLVSKLIAGDVKYTVIGRLCVYDVHKHISHAGSNNKKGACFAPCVLVKKCGGSKRNSKSNSLSSSPIPPAMLNTNTATATATATIPSAAVTTSTTAAESVSSNTTPTTITASLHHHTNSMTTIVTVSVSLLSLSPSPSPSYSSSSESSSTITNLVVS